MKLQKKDANGSKTYNVEECLEKISSIAASATTPKAAGTASVGSETAYARGDHVHPSDTSKLSTSGGVLTGTVHLDSGANLEFGQGSEISQNYIGIEQGVVELGRGDIKFDTTVDPMAADFSNNVSVTMSMLSLNGVSVEGYGSNTYGESKFNFLGQNSDEAVIIGGVGTPTVDTHAANKAYVDSKWDEMQQYVNTEIRNIIAGFLDKTYPVGSIYLSVNKTSPATLFGGTWTQLQNRFLLGAGSSYTNGATGGAATVTLTTNQIPSHNHDGLYYSYIDTKNLITLNGGTASYHIPWGSSSYPGDYGAGSGEAELITGEAGGGAAHNNMPPYLVVYMWKRTA